MEDILKKQRATSTTDSSVLKDILYHKYKQSIQNRLNSLQKDVYLDANLFNQSRLDRIKDTIKKLPDVVNVFDRQNLTNNAAAMMYFPNQFPGSVHMTMWMFCLQLMASEQQKKAYYQKSLSCQIIGCYAQTQLGHGSDVQSLETTATLDKNSDEFVINTPSVSATKFWPGDLGLYANHAIVYAKVIVDNNSLGVFPIIVPIRDSNHNPLPGINCGDIGPKVGYITKDNGYLIFDNVRVPRNNLLNKLIDVSKQGQIQIKGDPKVLYASMMITRKLIITAFPKLYSNALTIATRYSIFRKMFKDKQGNQIIIANYQTQQDKLIPLIADYYAFTIDSNAIQNLTDINFEQVTKKGDSSLMAQCHSNLCYAKAYFTDHIEIGMDILRRACGGHGFSHYSGMPNLVQQFYAHPVHQGQNSVLYLQVARYIFKNYNKIKNNNSTVLNQLKPSVDYLKNIKNHIVYKANPDWTHSELLKIMSHAVCYLINEIHQRQNQFKNEMKSKDIKNFKNGIKLVELAKAHALYNSFKSFTQKVENTSNISTKNVLKNLSLLFGINHLLISPSVLIQSGCLERQHFESLRNIKESLLKKLRPQMIGLVDGFVISQKGLKSALTYGNVYKNMFELAKENKINAQISPAVWTIKNGLTNTRPKM